MLASRVAKPKLSLNISTAGSGTSSSRPSLSIKSPLTLAPLRSPASPLTPSSPVPASPTARNTKMNQRDSYYSSYSTLTSKHAQQQQQPTYAYPNYSSSRSILKKTSSASSSTSSSRSSSPMSTSSSRSSSSRRQLSFSDSPVVYTVTPIEEPDYYGSHHKMSRDERRWGSKTR